MEVLPPLKGQSETGFAENLENSIHCVRFPGLPKWNKLGGSKQRKCVLEFSRLSLKLRCQQGHASSESLGRSRSLPPPGFWCWPPVLGVPRFAAAALVAASVSTWHSPSVLLSPSVCVCVHISFLHGHQLYWVMAYPTGGILT